MADTEELTSKPADALRRPGAGRRRRLRSRSSKNAAGWRAAAPAAESSGKRTNRRNNFNSKRNSGKETNTDKGTKRQPVRKPTKTPVPIASSVLRRERKKKGSNGSSGKLGVDNEIAKQRAIVARLRNENKSLEQELSLEKHLSAVTGRDAAQKEIEKLQATGINWPEEYSRKSAASSSLMGLQRPEKITKQKMRVGDEPSKENARRLDKHIKLLESRLDNALKRYNKALAVNKGLRKQVDESRQERVIFDGVYKKLEWQLHENKMRIKELDKQAETASAARDAAKDELRKITEEAEQARVDFEKHWRQLGEEIAADRAAKGKQQRNETQLNVVNAQMGVDGDGTKNGSTDIRRDNILSQRDAVQSEIAKSKWSIGKDKIHTALSLEKVKEYEEAFKKIQNATGIKDIETLVEQFIEAEDNNFALYSHVNRLAAESERLEQAMADVRGEIEKYRGQGANTVNQRKRILKSVEAKLEASEKRAEDYEYRHEEIIKVLDKMKDGVQRLFTHGCYSPEVADMLGDQGVTDSNIMQYLGIIEQRATKSSTCTRRPRMAVQKLCRLSFSSARRESVPGKGAAGATSRKLLLAVWKQSLEVPKSQKLNYDSILGVGASTQHEHVPINVEPPSIDAFDAEDELASITGIDSERPIPREELQRKTQELREDERRV